MILNATTFLITNTVVPPIMKIIDLGYLFKVA